MPSETRARRVADRINRELAILLQRKVADPRLAGLTVTGVDVDRELAYATIYVAAQEEEQEVLTALESARGFLRKELASNIPMRAFPQLRFRWDYSPDRGARVDELLDRLQKEREEREARGEASQDDPLESTPHEGERDMNTDDS
ncbi:MAG: 30S ribosome-binding factor RbfA [Anaerolineales bacterium]